MTKMVMKFPPYIEKNLSQIIKIDKRNKKGLIITLFKQFKDIFTRNSMIKSHSSTGASSIYVHAAYTKTLQVYKNWL